MSSADPEGLLCPSAQPDQDSAVLFGVVDGTAAEPRVTYLRQPLPVVPALLALAQPVAPTEVFRFAAPCVEDACQHFAAGECQLATKISALIEGTSFGVPACRIRPRCRWWNQEGVAACHKCPTIVTMQYAPSAAIREAADPTSRPGSRLASPRSKSPRSRENW